MTVVGEIHTNLCYMPYVLFHMDVWLHKKWKQQQESYRNSQLEGRFAASFSLPGQPLSWQGLHKIDLLKKWKLHNINRRPSVINHRGISRNQDRRYISSLQLININENEHSWKQNHHKLCDYFFLILPFNWYNDQLNQYAA